MTRRYFLGHLSPDAALQSEQLPDGPRVMIAHPGRRIDEVFTSDTVPTFASHGKRYAAVFMSRTSPNPHCRTVADAESLVKKYPELGTVPR